MNPTGSSPSMDYGDYLHLDEVLGAQHPLSPDHNELLFIVQHQSSELWMKLMLHELRAAVAHVADDQLQPAFKMLSRVSKIMEQLVHAWDVLATMTPPEYSAIRPYLGHSSGFQSWQYRCIEFACGNKKAAMLEPHRHRSNRFDEVEAALHVPSLYDESLRLLARRGIDLPAEVLQRDVTQPYTSHPAVEAAWLETAERCEVRRDVQGEPVPCHPAPHRGSDRGDLLPADPHAGQTGPARARHVHPGQFLGSSFRCFWECCSA